MSMERAEAALSSNRVVTGVLDGWQLEQFARSLRAAQRSPGTVDRYSYHVRRFAGQHPDPWAVTMVDVEGRLALCRTPEYARAVRVAIHAWYAWAIRAGLGDTDPTSALPPVRIPRRHGRPCPSSVIAKARLRADDETLLMILLACQSGLRRSEIASAHTRDVRGQLLRVVGKGAKERDVPLTPDTRRLIDALPPGWFFPGRRAGQHLSADAVGRRISRSLGPGWSAHTLRHHAAQAAYDDGHDILMVADVLGHSSVATTQVYLATGQERLMAFVRHCS